MQAQQTTTAEDQEPPTPVRVMAVDAHPVFRAAARELIAAIDGFEQVGEAAVGHRAVELATELRPDLVLVDVRSPGMDGIQTARHIADGVPDAVVVLISVEDRADLPSSAMGPHVAAHIRKQDLSPAMLRGVWTVHRRRG